MPERRTHGREFFAGQRQRDCLSRFSVHFFRRVFLNRMGQVITGYGRPLSVSMPNRAKSGIRARFPLGVRILLRKTPAGNEARKIQDRQSRCRCPAKNSRPCWLKKEMAVYALHFLLPSRSQERNPLPGFSLPPRASLPVAFQNLLKKMVVFLIVPKGRFMTVLGGVV